jgi:hypothetical protein|nr:MAG TPA: hypothetical protein [Caudoviricetes sp.]
MKTIKVKDNQILLDIALQYYGTAEAIAEILANNSGIKNDPQTIVNSGRPLGSFYPDVKLEVGSSLLIDDDSRRVKKTVVKKIENDVTTYMTEQWQERLNK